MTERTDRELLELAAKAAGIEGSYAENSYRKTNGLRINSFLMNTDLWNPLTDDGDALRLAVKLRLCLFLEIPRIGVGPMVDGPELYLEEGEDPYAATRRAIVRCAAEIGAKP